MDFLNQAFEKAREIDSAELEQETGEGTQEEIATEVPSGVSHATAAPQIVLGDPRISQTKGRKSEKEKTNAAENSRFKSGMELSQTRKRPRTCSHCKFEGHDSRTCAKKKADKLAANNANGEKLLSKSFKSYCLFAGILFLFISAGLLLHFGLRHFVYIVDTDLMNLHLRDYIYIRKNINVRNLAVPLTIYLA
ncbi:hypothetical protein MKW94_002554 [Papaver nudicaule]|uniref:Uncharacterized protein n=1 Tax=Papaver nudicaule TaxID=74823 RepID=A0AA41V8L7_PAPNU|nr:hypothetical protein [Papaver nudicaule]